MAVAVYQNNSGDWDDADNWSGGSGADGKPANDDDVLIASGTYDLDTNVTTGLTGLRVFIGPGYTGSFGTSSAYVDLDGSIVQFRGSGDCYLTGTITTVEIYQLLAGKQFALKGNASTAVGALWILNADGDVDVYGSADLDELYVYGTSTPTVTIAASVTGLDTIYMETGDVTTSSSVATASARQLVVVRGGLLTVDGAAELDYVIVGGGGVVAWNSSGKIDELLLIEKDGYFDGRSNQNSGVVIDADILCPGGTLDLRNGIIGWTLSDHTNKGGRYYEPLGV